jgi:hypothetical protein
VSSMTAGFRGVGDRYRLPRALSLIASSGPEGRRERKARRETDAAHDRLTVQARLAVVSARKLTTAELDDLFERALQRAKGDGHVANAAFAQVMALAHVGPHGRETRAQRA